MENRKPKKKVFRSVLAIVLVVILIASAAMPFVSYF